MEQVAMRDSPGNLDFKSGNKFSDFKLGLGRTICRISPKCQNFSHPIIFRYRGALKCGALFEIQIRCSQSGRLFKGAGHVERLAGSHSAVACLATQLRCTWHFRRSEDLRSRALYERTRLAPFLPSSAKLASLNVASYTRGST